MYGRRDDRFLDRGRSPGRDGYNSYGYGSGQDSYRPPSDTWMSSYDGPANTGLARESSYYDRPERPRYDYFASEGGYGGRREQYPPRPAQQGWRSEPRGSFRGNFGSSPSVRGARHTTPPRERGAYPELSSFHSLKAFTGNSYLGGGFKKRSKNRLYFAQNKTSKERGPPAEKKMRTTAENSEAKSKESESEADCTTEETAQSTKTEGDKEDETEEKTDGNAEDAAQSTKTDGDQEDEAQEKTEPTQSPGKKQEIYNRRIGDRLVEEIQFVCSICQFRTFYDEEMKSHLESDFHKSHFHYVGRHFPKKVASFLEEYVLHKTKRTEERRKHVEDLSNTIHQIHRNQDLTQGLGMEHFVKKVEAAHCAACDVLIPMHYRALQQHLKSPLHNKKRMSMMETSKKRGLGVAKIILNNKHIERKVELYKNGQNPFLNDYENTTESGGNTDLVSVAEESGQVACSTLSDSEKEEEEASGEQDTGQEENAEDSSNVCEDTEYTEVDASDG